MKAEHIQIDKKGRTITSDRGAAILSAYESQFIESMHLFCALHLTRNLKPFGNVMTYFWDARNATTEHDHLQAMAKLQALSVSTIPSDRYMASQGKGMYEYLTAKVGDRKWALHEFIAAGQMLYNMKKTNELVIIYKS